MTHNKIWVVVPAAGIGARVGATIPKQYIQLAGQAMLERTLQPFIACSAIEGIVVPLAENDRWWPQLPISSNSKVSSCIGGDDRASSVLAGLEHLRNTVGSNDDWVMVHDAARPCITTEQLESLIAQLTDSTVGGLWAQPSTDTLKRSNHNRRVLETIDREQVWRAQTPQMFPLELLQGALTTALNEGATITDEASAIEHIGLQPQLIKGPSHNIKVTYPSDVALAEFYLSQIAK